MDTFEGIVVVLVIILIFTPTPVAQIWRWLGVQFGWEWLLPHPPPLEYVAPLLEELRGLRNDINCQLVPILGLVRDRMESSGRHADIQRSGDVSGSGGDGEEMV